MKIRSEKGIALPLVMIIIMVGALIIPAFLGRVSANLVTSRSYSSALEAQYTGDSGAEHAIWNLVNGDVAGSIPKAGDFSSYNLDETVNGLTANVKISNSWEVIAWDNFNSGTWTGGGGWLGNWSHSGEALVTAFGTPYEGADHLRLRSSTGVVSRSVDLSKQVSAHLTFWAKVDSFELGDTAICRISHNGTDWTTIRTWTQTESDNVYYYYDLDLTPYGLDETFYISFKSNMNSNYDYFYVDDLNIIWPAVAFQQTAVEDFESAAWGGGENWLGDWTHSGASSVTVNGVPHSGSYHLLLQNNNGYAARSVDLSGQSAARLRFWAKVNAFESGDEAYCLVSSDGINWNNVHTWTNSDSDNTYHYYDLDISGYDLTDEFWIAFDAGMSWTTDYFYVDDISVDTAQAYCITVTTGDRILKAVVDLLGGDKKVLCWWYVV